MNLTPSPVLSLLRVPSVMIRTNDTDAVHNESETDVIFDSMAMEGREGGFKSSLGIEAVAIFAAVTFLVRVLLDVARRIRKGRSFDGSLMNLNDLSYGILVMINGAAKLYDHTSAIPRTRTNTA